MVFTEVYNGLGRGGELSLVRSRLGLWKDYDGSARLQGRRPNTGRQWKMMFQDERQVKVGVDDARRTPTGGQGRS